MLPHQRAIFLLQGELTVQHQCQLEIPCLERVRRNKKVLRNVERYCHTIGTMQYDQP